VLRAANHHAGRRQVRRARGLVDRLDFRIGEDLPREPWLQTSSNRGSCRGLTGLAARSTETSLTADPRFTIRLRTTPAERIDLVACVPSARHAAGHAGAGRTGTQQHGPSPLTASFLGGCVHPGPRRLLNPLIHRYAPNGKTEARVFAGPRVVPGIPSSIDHAESSEMPDLDRHVFTNSLFAIMFFIMSGLAVGCTGEKTAPGATADPRAEGMMTFYRLDGDRYPGDPVPPGTTLLHGYSVITSCEIPARGTREEILNAFDAGIAEYQDGISLDCFRPRHAIRIVQDGVTTDHLICFQCSNWMRWTDDERSGGGGTSDTPRETFDRILNSCSPSV